MIAFLFPKSLVLSLTRLLHENVRGSSSMDSSLTFASFLSADCRHAMDVQYQRDPTGVQPTEGPFISSYIRTSSRPEVQTSLHSQLHSRQPEADNHWSFVTHQRSSNYHKATFADNGILSLCSSMLFSVKSFPVSQFYIRSCNLL